MKHFHLSNSSLQKIAIAFALMLVIGAATVPVLAAPSPTPDAIEHALGLDQVGTPDSMLKTVMDILGSYVAKTVGIILGAYALVKMVIALKDQDANGITNSAIQFTIAVVLMLLRMILRAIFHI